MTTQTLNIALYMHVERNYRQTNGQTHRRMIQLLDAPIGPSIQARGIKMQKCL